ncbi:hypothetical protein [Sulfobacillus harzensis]|uniref:DUF4175 domain-containing protein n=1 Tax=Sulfobacillus harzensis TaxID=2729629 RepID=A0A7Y0L8R4_9FIRM|nr:hypothetical protein [Sulfobacillus harzensis]NMP25093.1 DUF4175 domain-containing protein [Sulfobacillus harzensis]
MEGRNPRQPSAQRNSSVGLVLLVMFVGFLMVGIPTVATIWSRAAHGHPHAWRSAWPFLAVVATFIAAPVCFGVVQMLRERRGKGMPDWAFVALIVGMASFCVALIFVPALVLQ